MGWGVQRVEDRNSITLSAGFAGVLIFVTLFYTFEAFMFGNLVNEYPASFIAQANLGWDSLSFTYSTSDGTALGSIATTLANAGILLQIIGHMFFTSLTALGGILNTVYLLTFFGGNIVMTTINTCMAILLIVGAINMIPFVGDKK